MLLIQARRNPSPAYYLRARPELDHVRGSLPEGFRAVGELSRSLGVGDTVDARTAAELIAGVVPSGARFASPRRQVACFELVFAAPKAISVLGLCAEAEVGHVVLAAHERGVETAVRYLEAQALAPNRREDPTEQAHGLLGLATVHGTSRNGDPHLHTHLLVANLVHGSDGRFGPLDGRGLSAHRRAAGALYDLEVAAGVERGLGVDLSSIDRRLLGALSSRRAELAYDPFVRPTAPEVTERAVLLERWRSHGEHLGAQWNLDRLTAAPPLPRRLNERAFARALLGGDHTITRRVVIEAWASAAPRLRAEAALSCVNLIVGPTTPGIFEAPLSQRSVLPTARELTAAGERPLDPTALSWWQHKVRSLTYLDRGSRARDEGDRSASHGRSR